MGMRGSREYIEYVGEWISKVLAERNTENNERKFFHYTSLENLFNVLEGDSLWLSNMRFSNDETEGTVLRGKGVEELDNYIVCFCDNGDRLSQWRGYCHHGGASIEFEMNGIEQYSVLNANYDKNRRYEIYYNTPLPVMYVKDEKSTLDFAIKTIEKTRPIMKDINLQMKDVVPYLKNDKFFEEREQRLAFLNIDGLLSDCIRFRKLANGVMIPYIVIKAGNIGRNAVKCDFDSDLVNEDYLNTIFDRGEDCLWIPEGSNQESVFNRVNSVVHEYNKGIELKESQMHIFCKGHLPVRKITVSPMPGMDRVREQIERYCYSKYWLRNVEVVSSEIPYVQ